jgi:hypothetical protein
MAVRTRYSIAQNPTRDAEKRRTAGASPENPSRLALSFHSLRDHAGEAPAVRG